MKKYFLILSLLLLVIVSGCSNKTVVDNKIKVSASIYPVYDFTKKIGGDKVSVTKIVPDGIEAHDWEPEAADIINIEQSSLFIFNGAGLEHWIDDVLSSTNNNDLVVVDSAKDVKLLTSNNKKTDPHIWLDPNNVKIQMKAIKEALVKIDPTNKEYYNNNYDNQIKKLTTLDSEFKTKLSAVKKRDIVVSHEAFGYLCNAYDLHQHGIAGLDPSIEPDAARMGEIIKFVETNNISTIFFEKKASSKVADAISKETKVATAVLSPLESIDNEKEDYYSVMEENLNALVKALK